jgi:hypothetical protein
VPDPVPAVVTFHVWTVSSRSVLRAVAGVGLDRWRARRTPGVTFARLLGATAPGGFTPRDSDLRRWALLACWSHPGLADAFEQSELVRRWNDRAEPSGRQRVAMVPLRSRGRWGGRTPFGYPAGNPVARLADRAQPPPAHPGWASNSWQGPVAVVTRARLKPLLAPTFWRAVPPIARELRDRPGLVSAFGIGEAPAIWQGTFSVWESASAVDHFAHDSDPHRAAIASTDRVGWYAEELFARFAVIDASGWERELTVTARP